ncbi:hypothetical protein F511_44769 [Dorcoceras hygrometricum]|uniref:Retrotransposon Copia-like N-terminal domain-containing protein n=2 Tax=Dorcoceras hygrometricum TaxID=472368 RepID=A0A2Z6ZYM9_9LAMI|nr:hypothetical protein F511_44769 [Dorcoceras hygrometricum]
MSSFKNPLAAILDSNKFTGLNYQDWLRNLNLVLASEKLLYTIEKCPPKEAPADISPEELVTLKQWWDDEVKAQCYVMASMSNEMQRRFEKTKYAADILFHLKELVGSTRRFDLTTACTDPIPQPAAVRTPRLHKCTNSRSCVTDYIHKSFTSSCLDGN